MRRWAFCFAVLLFGCDSSREACAPARSTTPPDCPDGTFANATTFDPTCVSASGAPVCRDPTDSCLICSGSDFQDRCRVLTAGNNYECVHRCGMC